MRTLPIAGSLLALFVAFSAYGCVLDVTGLTPATTGTGSSAVGPGGADPSTATGTSGGTGGVPTTSTTTTGTGCIPVAEDCSNGLDDDCDGDIDCADPDCSGPSTGRECVAPPPAGWTLIAFVPGSSAACPAGSGAAADVVEAPTSASTTCTCACDCSGVDNNPCVHGTLGAKIGNGCSVLDWSLDVTGGCDALPAMISSHYGSIKATPLGITPIDVTGDATLPGLKPGASGTTCAPDATMAGGCAGGGACLPKATSAHACIQSSGDVVCPASPFTVRRVVSASGMIDDQRKCDTCTCTSSASSCSTPTFSGFPDDKCDSMPLVSADVIANVCTTTPGNSDWKSDDHFVYSSMPSSPTCAVKGALPAVKGTMKLQNPTTICCLP